MSGEGGGQSADYDALRRELENALGGYRVAAECADRFRDVLADALGYEDESPGDDVLIRDLRAHFGRTGPEPTRWRDFCTSALAVVDQINAGRADDGRPAECTCPPGGGLPLCAYVNEGDPEDADGYRPVRFGCVLPPGSSDQ